MAEELVDRLHRIDKIRAGSIAFKPWRYPTRRDALTAAADFPLATTTPKGLVYAQTDETAGVWRSYESIPEVWAPLNYLARAIQQVELGGAIHVPGESAPVALSESNPQLATVVDDQLSRLRSITGGFNEILFAAAIQLLVPGKALFVADTDDDGNSVFMVLSTSEVRKREDVYERQVGAKEWKPIDGYVRPFWRPHARYSWKAHSSLYPLQGACDEILLIDRMYRSNARSRISRGVFLAPREADYQSLQPNRTHPEQNSLAYALMRILTAPISEEDSSLNVAPGVLELKGDYIEKFKHITFGSALDKEVAARYDKCLDRVADGIDLPAALAKGLKDTQHWNAWAITDDAFDQYAAPLCELICSALTTVFLWPSLEAVSVTERPIIWYDPFRLRSRPPEGEEVDKAFDRGAISWESYRQYRSINEDDAPDDQELDRRVELGLFKGAGGGGAGAPSDSGSNTGTTSSPTASRDAAPASYYPSEPPPFGVSAAGWDEEAHPRGPDGKFGSGDGDSNPLRFSWYPSDVEIETTKRPVQGSVTPASDIGARLVTLDRKLLDALAKETAQLVQPALAAQAVQAAGTNQHAEAVSLFHRLVAPVQVAAARVARSAGFTGDWLRDRQERALAAGAEQYASDVDDWLGQDRTDRNSAVPTGTIRRAVSIAGGMKASATAAAHIAGGVATGPHTITALRESGLGLERWVWQYGPSDRSFPGHERLDGAEFNSWEDDVLAVQPEDAWLGRDFYAPDDHIGCMCLAEPVFAALADVA